MYEVVLLCEWSALNDRRRLYHMHMLAAVKLQALGFVYIHNEISTYPCTEPQLTASSNGLLLCFFL